jgi:periplasmic divalent cation tolerance protein
MTSGGQYRCVFVTCDSLNEARRIARAVVTKRLVACANIFLNPVESVYRWKGNVEKAREFLMAMKTTSKRLSALEREVKRLHSYDVPEFIALPVNAGSSDYLGWLRESVSNRTAR